MLKETIQLVFIANKDVVLAVQERLWNYHSIPHSTTGILPFILLRVTYSANSLSPAWVVKKTKCNSRTPSKVAIREKVLHEQGKSKLHYDSHTAKKAISFEVGDVVRVKKPFHVTGGKSKFFPATKLISVGKHAVRVQDGKWWNKRAVAKLISASALSNSKSPH